MRWKPWVAAGLLIVGVSFFCKGAWIYIKAELAQHLLERAWSETQSGGEPVKPWSWADTWPVARLEAPRLGVNRLVLNGATGRTLAFGPGHLTGSAKPGASGNTVLAGHRDTHFAFLRDLKPGDALRLETPDGGAQHYRVQATGVAHHTRTEALNPTGVDSLTLVTCYPFDAIVPGGPLRYVVQAVATARPPRVRKWTESARREPGDKLIADRGDGRYGSE